MKTRTLIILAGLLLLAGAAFWLRMVVGGPAGSDVIREFRLQRGCSGLIVGIALATAGVLLQCLFRNPLASPDLLGMSSGAGVAVMAWQLAAYHAGFGIAQPTLGAGGAGVALPGAVAALFLTYLLSQRRGLIDPITLILTGVVVGLIAAAAMTLIQQLLPDRGVAASRLLLGSISDDADWRLIAGVGLVVLVALGWAIARGSALDAASLSDDEARSVGVPLARLRIELFVWSGVLTAVTFALCGPVAFVGLVCPHLVRLMIGPGHRALVIGASLVGATLVVFADAMVRVTDFHSGRLPISVLTALLGGPILIWMLRAGRRPG